MRTTSAPVILFLVALVAPARVRPAGADKITHVAVDATTVGASADDSFYAVARFAVPFN
jgi:hypothetical protein